jgi:hypothetical protein
MCQLWGVLLYVRVCRITTRKQHREDVSSFAYNPTQPSTVHSPTMFQDDVNQRVHQHPTITQTILLVDVFTTVLSIHWLLQITQREGVYQCVQTRHKIFMEIWKADVVLSFVRKRSQPTPITQLECVKRCVMLQLCFLAKTPPIGAWETARMVVMPTTVRGCVLLFVLTLKTLMATQLLIHV